MLPTWQRDGVSLYLGDCRDLNIEADAIVTDPPYGCRNNCDYTRFTGGKSDSRNYPAGIAGDDQPFDPTPWLAYPKVLLFGYQYFADKLPQGTILVWNKRRENQLGKFLSDAELAWMKGGKGVYLFNHVWNGFDRASERGKSIHPSQKPAALMRWCIERLKLKPGSTIFDPFMGSGPVAQAAVELGFKYVGCEINETYFNAAVARLKQSQPSVAA